MPRRTKEKQKKVRILSRFAVGSRALFAAALLSALLLTVFNALTPQVIRITVDSVIGEEPFALPAFLLPFIERIGGRGFLRLNLWWTALPIAVFSLLSGLSNYCCRTSTARGAEGFVKRLRDELYAHIQRLPYAWHVRHQTGDLIQRCTSDVEVVRGFIANQLIEVFRTLFLIGIAMALMFSMNVKLSLIALAFIPLVMGYSGAYFHRIAKRFRRADEAEGVLSAAVQENLTGVRVVRAFGREAYEIERFDEKNEEYANRWMRLGKVLGSYWGLGDLFTGMQILTVVVFGTVEAVNGRITLGEFLAFVFYNSTLIWPIRSLGRILSDMGKCSVSFERLRYILGAEEEQDAPGALTPPLDGDIRFEHVRFAYEELDPVLQDVDFTIARGSTFAILGATGCGKSTLMHLLNRLYELPPDCGRITIGGVDIRDIQLAHLRRNVAMVLQEPFLFSRSIRENIAATRPGAPLEEVRAAARIACVDDAIEGFPQQYDTLVGERGVTLSGGQRQRVAIARALVPNAPILVFDDSLSAVDSETDAHIRQALRENENGATVILISHRITTLMHADNILVMENGRITESGTHEELIAHAGTYRRIYDIQFAEDDRILTEGGDADGAL